MKQTKNNLFHRLLCFVLCAVMIVPMFIDGFGTLDVFADDLPKAYVDSAVTTETGSVSVTIHLDKAAPADLTVSYHTENRTAMAGVDYTAASGKVSFRQGQQQASVIITVSIAKDLKTVEFTNAKGEKTTYNHEFLFCLDGADGATVDYSKNKCTVSIKGKWTIQAAESATIKENVTGNQMEFYYLSEYMKFIAVDLSEDDSLTSDDNDGDDYHWSFLTDIAKDEFAKQTAWTQLISSGIADPYFGFYSVTTDCSMDRLAREHAQIYYGNAEFQNYVLALAKSMGSKKGDENKENDEKRFTITAHSSADIISTQNGSVAPGLFFAYDYYNSYTSALALYGPGFQKLSGNESSGGYRPRYMSDSGDRMLLYGTTENKSRGGYFFKCSPYNGTTSVCLGIVDKNDTYDYWCRYKAEIALLDTQKAKVVDIAIDDSAIMTEGKILLSVRFNEPVYVPTVLQGTTKIEVECFNGSRWGSALQFDFGGGNMTDTLWFVYNIPDTNVDIEMYKYRISGGMFAKQVRDMSILPIYGDKTYSKNLGVQDGYKDIVRELEIPLLYKDPVLSTTVVPGIEDKDADKFAKSYSVTINTRTYGCDLRYKWDQIADWSDPMDKTNYDNQTVLSGDTMSTTVSFGDDSMPDGEWYLHIYAENKYHRKATQTVGPFNIDRTAPKLTVELTNESIYEKRFKITVYDQVSVPNSITGNKEPVSAAFAATQIPKFESCYITDLSLLIGADPDNMQTIPLLQGATKTGVDIKPYSHLIASGTDSDGNYIFEYVCKIKKNDGESESVLQKEILKLLEDNNKTRMDVYIGFKATDNSRANPNPGNTTYSEVKAYTFDSRTSFPTTGSATVSGTGGTPETALMIDEKYPVYNIGTGTNAGLDFTVTTTQQLDGNAGERFRLVDQNGKEYTCAGTTCVATNLAPGYYELVPEIIGNEGELGQYSLASQSYRFYVTRGGTEETENYKKMQSGTALINKVYQLEDARFTYMPSDGGSPTRINYGATYETAAGAYTGGASDPAFSSQAAAEVYLKYMEYQDMHLVKLNENLVRLLESTLTAQGYEKADGETQVAQEGQYWIRYKRANWTKNCYSYDWVYYYYPNCNGKINIDTLPASLKTAVSSVASYLAGFGSDVYLVGENTSAVSGAPYLRASQMHANIESVETSITGSPFTMLVYQGDTDIYDSEIETAGGKTLSLVTNIELTVGRDSYFFYKPASSADSDSFIPFFPNNGQPLSKALNNATTGSYIIREVDKTGMAQYEVYIDTIAPRLTVQIDGSREETLSPDSRQIPAQSLKFISLNTDELDPYAYVALFNYATGKLLRVYYKGDLSSASPIQDGNYLIEVGDRSGNRYSLPLLLSSSELEYSVAINSYNSGVVVKCTNRIAEEIYRYEVSCNNVPLDVDKNQLVSKGETFRESGIYVVKIQDIYGNEPEIPPLTFKFQTPDVVWYTQRADGSFSKYESDRSSDMIVRPDPDMVGKYNVYTSKALRFKLDNSIGTPVCEFISGVSDGDYTVSRDGLDYTMNNLSNWSMEVWFEEHPDDRMIYNVIIDASMPTVKATFVGPEYVKNEEKPLLSEFGNKSLGTILTPTMLSYERSTGTVRNLTQGSVISGSGIHFTVTDASGIKSIDIQRVLEGATANLEMKQIFSSLKTFSFSDTGTLGKDHITAVWDGGTNSSPPETCTFTVNDMGSYTISVTDALGNTRKYSFENKDRAFADIIIDGGTGHKFEDTVYGNKTLETSYLTDCDVQFLLKENDTTRYYFYRLIGGEIYACKYCLSADVETEEKLIDIMLDETPLYTIDDVNYVPGEWFILDEKAEYITDPFTQEVSKSKLYYSISVAMNSDGKAAFKIEGRDSDLAIEIRCMPDNGQEPAYVNAKLSNKQSDIKLVSGNVRVETNHNGEMIYGTGALKILEVDAEVMKIEMAFTTGNTFANYTTIYDIETGKTDYSGIVLDQDGVYSLIIHNMYGNTTEYRLSVSDRFTVVASTKYINGKENSLNVREYIDSLGGARATLCTNNYCIITVYGESLTFIINNTIVTPEHLDGVYILSITGNGLKSIEISDLARNKVSFDVFIGTDANFKFNESWIFGYNENALRKSEGYTNKKLSITQISNFTGNPFSDKAIGTIPMNQMIARIAVEYEDGTTDVVYDELTETLVVDPALLNECIGLHGDGEYTVFFTNMLGDEVSKIIHYRETPTLKLTRTTTFSGVEENVNILDAIAKGGAYSNLMFTFSTDSTGYEFRVKGEKISLDNPYILEFNSTTGEGTLPYTISYKDDYGFDLSFTAYLQRKEVDVDMSAMDLIELDKKTYTTDNIQIFFADGYIGYVSIDGGELTPYKSGTVLSRDGTYAFQVVDNAGNLRSFTIRHDSVINFKFVTDGDEELPLDDGVVVNANYVAFISGENAVITNIFFNGEEVTGYTSNMFRKTGSWEIIVEDDVGNRTLFSFLLINNALAHFEYDPPYGFIIQEVWVSSDVGNRRFPYTSGETLVLDEEGVYSIILLREGDNRTVNFNVTIDKALPEVTLSGCEDGGITPYEVSLKNVKIGDKITVYKDGEFLYTMENDGTAELPVFEEGGKYRIDITNLAGMTQTLSFTKKYIANTATSVLIIFACIAGAVGVFIGLILRNRTKTDD